MTDTPLTPEQLPGILREWRAGIHHYVDEEGRETGEMEDQPKDFRTLQIEREQAADALESALAHISHLEQQLEIRSPHFTGAADPEHIA